MLIIARAAVGRRYVEYVAPHGFGRLTGVAWGNSSARYALRMGLLLDSFWRASVYCLRPRVILISTLPLLVIAVLACGFSYFYWDASVAAMRGLLDSFSILAGLWSWLQGWGVADAASVVAPLMVVAATAPLIVVASLLLVGVLSTPTLVRLVADRRFPDLERRQGGSFFASVTWALGSTVLALVALVLSIPLWFVPPLVLVLPPLIWGWLTYRVMSFDALSEHASKEERQELFKRYRSGLLGIGVVTGYLSAAPSIVWASGVIFAAAFLVLIPLAIWIYTLVFVFSSLWFTHYCLAALERLRHDNALAAQRTADLAIVEVTPSAMQPAALLADERSTSPDRPSAHP